MRITQRELNRYRDSIKSRQDDASAYVIARIQNEARGLTVGEAREKTIEIMSESMGIFGDQAQALSVGLFDEVCEVEGIPAAPGEMFDDIIDASRLSSKVHYFAGRLVNGDWDGYVSSNADLAAFYVHRSALQNMERNCYKNRIKYARVATGRETCGFCFMLSTRGFDYRSEKTASAASHMNCDCIIVPGVDGVTKIEGYEPEKMYSRWKDCEQTIGGKKQILKNFNALSDEEYKAIKGRSRQEKWRRYYPKQIQKEAETRDNGWLYRGWLPEITWNKTIEEYQSTSEGKRELLAIKALREKGFNITTRKEDAPDNYSNTDLLIGNKVWEIKVPKQGKSSSRRFIENDVRKAKRQFEKYFQVEGEDASKVRVIMSNQVKKYDDDEFIKRFSLDVERHGIQEALYISSKGEILRIK